MLRREGPAPRSSAIGEWRGFGLGGRAGGARGETAGRRLQLIDGKPTLCAMRGAPNFVGYPATACYCVSGTLKTAAAA